MGTNYYFRKKSVDPSRIDSIFDELNNDYKMMIERYNKKLKEEFLNMGLDTEYDIDDRNSFYPPHGRDNYGDIHVGKLSAGWKPLMQANEHFNSIESMRQWYEDNKDEYAFIDEYGEIVDFNEYLEDITERNNDVERKRHPNTKSSDGFDWEYRQFS